MTNVKIRCCGRMHTITLLDNGCLALVDHARGVKTSDKVMDKVGLNLRCDKILANWRDVLAGKKILSTLPKDLQGPAKDAIARHRGKKAEPWNLIERVRRRTEETLRRLIMTNGYDIHSDVEQYIYDFQAHPTLVVALFTGVHGRFKDNSPPADQPSVIFEWKNMGHCRRFPRVRLWVPLGWYYKIHMNGLSVLDGRVVLAYRKDDDRVAILGQDSRSHEMYLRWVPAPKGWIERARSGMKEKRCRRAGTKPRKPASKRWLRRLLGRPAATTTSA